MPQDHKVYLPPGGKMGELIRSMDWSGTPLGPIEKWPQSLQTALSICLHSQFPILLWWGPEMVMLYNDAYRPILGSTKHPQSLGQRGRECWPEIWDIIGPMLEGVLERGEATWSDDQMLPLDRYGFTEECYFTFSYSPIQEETGGVGGIFTAVTETTRRVLGERRLKTLRDLASRTGEGKNVREAGEIALGTLSSNSADVPFALEYLLSDGGEEIHFVGSTNIDPTSFGIPTALVLNTIEDGLIQKAFAESVQTGKPVVLTDLNKYFDALPGGPWLEPTHTAVVLPLTRPSLETPYGLLVCGVSPRRMLDSDYLSFFRLVAEHSATAMANAMVFQEEKRRAEALAEIDRAKTLFFSNVSHEFRTPLTLMLGLTEDALSSPGHALDGKRLETVHRNQLRLLKLVNSLLDFSRIEGGRIEAIYEPVDLASLTTDLASMFRSAIEGGGLSLIVDCPQLGEPVYVDRDMWERIVMNLISNAFKFTFEGEIGVTLRAVDGKVELAVRDTGIGISEKELPRLFERFHRIKDVHSRTHEGTGIGLALVQELVKLHGGSIDVSSMPGQGSTFKVHIPFGRKHLPDDLIGVRGMKSSTSILTKPFIDEALSWIPREVEHDGGNQRVIPADELPGTLQGPELERSSYRLLVADDNADMREYLKDLLSTQWKVSTHPDGASALKASLDNPPDLVLADVMMPGLDGFELLRQLRTQFTTREIPVVLLSARAGEESRIEGLRAGANDYLVKPFSSRELIARIAAQLEIARIRRETEQSLRELADDLEEKVRQRTLELEQANRAKDQFLANMSHEIRTPMSGVLGMTEILLHQDLPAKVQEDLAIVRSSAESVMTLINDLFDLSRINQGKFDFHPEEFDLRAMVRDAIGPFEFQAHSKDLDFSVSIDESVPSQILCDQNRLGQVIKNLLSNAIKFTERGFVRVHVEAEKNDEDTLRLNFTVADSGLGIPRNKQKDVFSAFTQLDPSYSKKFAGMGLGLAISKSLVEGMGGEISVESTRGRGATFRFSITCGIVNEDKESKAPGIALKDLPPMTILIAEDNAVNRLFLRRALVTAGNKVGEAENGRHALEKLNDTQFDLVLMDIQMPEMDGLEAMQRIRSGKHGRADIPIIALTAYAMMGDREKFLENGMDGYVTKPVDFGELARTIAEICGLTSSS
jgi:signal transduction histidine kinase